MARPYSQQLLIALGLSLVLTACRGTSYPVPPLPEQSSVNCAADILAFRSGVDSSAVTDAGSPALRFFPLLHSNRFLHGLSHDAQSDAEVREWVGLLAQLGIATRAGENVNLDTPWSDDSLAQLAECSRDFASQPRHRQERLDVLDAVQQSDFPANYLQTRQTLGALALLRPFLRQRILALHGDEKRWYAETESFEQSTHYALDDSFNIDADIGAWMTAASQSNALALPLLADAQLDALLAKHAPDLQIEYRHDNDRIGSPQWSGERLRINTDLATVYTLTSMTRFEGRNLLQLNYVFWFSERKPKALIDLYSGDVDSIIWRVTLDGNGQPLLYDSIHSCGCYHKYFIASENLRAKAVPESKEPANIFSLDADVIPGQLSLVITANEHYIVGVEPKTMSAPQQAVAYALSPYSRLQKLRADDGYRSLFDSQGLIPSSERLERFTLWPTGILSVGAMRQWGTHATGFIEEQHFDDANLLDWYFETAH